MSFPHNLHLRPRWTWCFSLISSVLFFNLILIKIFSRFSDHFTLHWAGAKKASKSWLHSQSENWKHSRYNFFLLHKIVSFEIQFDRRNKQKKQHQKCNLKQVLPNNSKTKPVWLSVSQDYIVNQYQNTSSLMCLSLHT